MQSTASHVSGKPSRSLSCSASKYDTVTSAFSFSGSRHLQLPELFPFSHSHSGSSQPSLQHSHLPHSLSHLLWSPFSQVSHASGTSIVPDMTAMNTTSSR